MAEIYSFLLNRNVLHLPLVEHENGEKNCMRKMLKKELKNFGCRK